MNSDDHTTPQEERSLRTGSIARFVADSLGIGFSLVAGVLTARILGPANKGNLSALLFLAIVFTHIGMVGLGDATIILVGRGSVSFTQAVQSALPVGVLAAGLASVLGVAAAWVQFSGEAQLHKSMLAAGTLVFVGVLAALLTSLLNARERIVLTSVVLAVNLGTTAFLTWLFVRVIDLAVLGGVSAAVFGNAVAVVVLLAALTLMGVSLRPRFDGAYARSALRLGLPIQAAYVLIALSQRSDQLIVLTLDGKSGAGIYAVSLTLGALVMYPAVAMSIATFPRLATVAPDNARLLVERVVRMTLLTAAAAALVLCACTPMAVRVLFGSDYAGAVVPSMILLAAGVPSAIQWTLARSLAARGRPEALFGSYSVCVVLMVVLDVLIVPAHGPKGAASVSLVTALIGMVMCLVLGCRELDLRPGQLLPSRAEIDDLRSLVPVARR